jgi:hypothetical protein
MTEEKVVTTTPAPKTEADLKADMAAAVKSGDWKAIAKIAREIDQLQTAKDKAERDAKLAVLTSTGEKVKAAIMKALKPFVDSNELEIAEGVFFSWDFGDANLQTIRLMKNQPKAKTASAGSGAGKKFDITTKELLEKYGSQVMNVETGETYQAAYDATTDGNKRFGIRNKLLKLNGNM